MDAKKKTSDSSSEFWDLDFDFKQEMIIHENEVTRNKKGGIKMMKKKKKKRIKKRNKYPLQKNKNFKLVFLFHKKKKNHFFIFLKVSYLLVLSKQPLVEGKNFAHVIYLQIFFFFFLVFFFFI